VSRLANGQSGARLCRGCNTELPAAFLACPSCGALVYADELRVLAKEAEAAEARSDHARALAGWRQVLDRLPAPSAQYATVVSKVRALSALVPADAPREASALPDASSGEKPRSGGKWAAGLGGIGVLLAKFKWVILFALGKLKVLLLGLTQLKTVFSMVFAIGVYTLTLGWRFALGLVLTTYVHEMGHVVWLRRYGIDASAPMFVPGLGAFVRLNQYPATPAEDARIGLAGPIWGAGASVLTLVLGEFFQSPMLLAIARVSAWINLFNLLPIWQLDGARGFSALSRKQRGWVAGVSFALACLTLDGMLFVLAAVAAVRAANPTNAPEKGDTPVFATFVGLLAGLTLLVAQLPAMPR
jgi:Zn-dependent protease